MNRVKFIVFTSPFKAAWEMKVMFWRQTHSAKPAPDKASCIPIRWKPSHFIKDAYLSLCYWTMQSSTKEQLISFWHLPIITISTFIEVLIQRFSNVVFDRLMTGTVIIWLRGKASLPQASWELQLTVDQREGRASRERVTDLRGGSVWTSWLQENLQHLSVAKEKRTCFTRTCSNRTRVVAFNLRW